MTCRFDARSPGAPHPETRPAGAPFPSVFLRVPRALAPRTRATLWRRLAGGVVLAGLIAAATPTPAPAELFRLPTANRALFEPGGEVRFFAPTPGRTWEAGQFGCVRSEGWQMHEGIDILATTRDRRGEPTDEVQAAAAGSVAYVNRKAALSNYGIYVVLRHTLEGLEVFTLYAHLREVRAGLAAGSPVRAGDVLGIMGRTANTATSISRERAHLHFEIDLVLNERFSAWLRRQDPKARDDHGPWNGRNLAGLDPAEIFRRQQQLGARFSLLDHLRNRPEMFRVLIDDTSFPWLRRYPRLIRRNPVAESAGIVAYEASFDYNGVPFRWMPRSRQEIDGALSTRLLSVDEAEYRRHPCRKLVIKRGQVWSLTARGRELLSLLTH